MGIDEYEGFWTYIFMSYSRYHRTVSYFVGFPDTTAYGYITKVLHLSPKYLALHIGRDGIVPGWSGKFKKVVLRAGVGSYINPESPSAEHEYPLYFENRLDNSLTWFITEDDGAMQQSPNDPDDEGNVAASFDIQIDEETTPDADIEGISEYGFGIWTRWTMTFPHVLLDKSDFHQLFRVTTTRVYQDVSQNGNRMLASFISHGSYHFATYDRVRDVPNVYADIKYDDQLEGYWNFVYFCYKRFSDNPRAVGYVYFGNTKDVRRIEMNNVKHFLLRDYLKVVVGRKEFSYMSFQGRVFDPRLFLGTGAFIDSGEDLVKS